MNAKIVGCSYIREIKIEKGSLIFKPTEVHRTRTDSTMLSIANAVSDGHKILKIVPVDGFKSDDALIEEFVFTIEDIKVITLCKIIEEFGAPVYGFRISLSTLRRMILDAKFKHVSATEFVTNLE